MTFAGGGFCAMFLCSLPLASFVSIHIFVLCIWLFSVDE